jgi:hypothetical protein
MHLCLRAGGVLSLKSFLLGNWTTTTITAALLPAPLPPRVCPTRPPCPDVTDHRLAMGQSAHFSSAIRPHHNHAPVDRWARPRTGATARSNRAQPSRPSARSRIVTTIGQHLICRVGIVGENPS